MKKTSFLSIILVLFVGVLVASCSGGGSEPSTSNTYFRFKLNGVEKNYNNATADYRFVQSRNKHSSIYVTGRELVGVSSNNPTLSIQLDAALLDSDDNWVGMDLVAGIYSAQYNTQYILGCNHYVTGLDNYTIDDENFVLNVQYIDKHRAKGTFSGVLKDHNDQVMTITNGEFDVPVDYRAVAN
ncbi:MAG: hypothetical protein Q4B43_09090 [Bacteroidota bacterium]|nr:hypothetical protein [Bacteroidota bacterium]